MTPHPGTAPPKAARLLAYASVALAVLAAGWFLVNLVHRTGPSWVLWSTMPAYGPLLAATFWFTSRSPALPEGTQRFWRHLVPVALLTGASQVAQAVFTLRNPTAGTEHAPVPTLGLSAMALLMVCYALIRLPLGTQARGSVIRIVLDAGTVAVAAGTAIWHFSTREETADGMTPETIAALALVVGALLMVFAVMKVLLSDYSAINGQGLRLIASAIFVGALAPLLQPLLPAGLYITELHIPIVFGLGTWAATVQWNAAEPRRARTRRRPYSVLPYVAVAGIDALLLVVVCGDRVDLVPVSCAAVLLTALVAVRQLTALRDNGRLLDQLDHLANHDELTGLANRALFQRRLQEALDGPADRPVSVVLLDLDGFKQVNDTFGHEAGDRLLVAVGERLAAGVREGDTAARLGGDEFVIVLDGADRAEATEIADRVLLALREPVRAPGLELAVHASVGIAGGFGGDEPDALLHRADLAMYAAKKVTGSAHRHADESLSVA